MSTPTISSASTANSIIYLARLLRRERFAIVETWPMGVYRFLARFAPLAGGLPPGDDAWRHALLDRFVDGLDDRCDIARADARDRLDGIAAALAAWAHASRRSQVVSGGPGSEDEGAIVLPSAAALA